MLVDTGVSGPYCKTKQNKATSIDTLTASICENIYFLDDRFIPKKCTTSKYRTGMHSSRHQLELIHAPQQPVEPRGVEGLNHVTSHSPPRVGGLRHRHGADPPVGARALRHHPQRCVRARCLCGKVQKERSPCCGWNNVGRCLLVDTVVQRDTDHR